MNEKPSTAGACRSRPSARSTRRLYRGDYGSDLRSPAFWRSPGGRARAALKPSIERMLDEHPPVSSAELASARDTLRADLDWGARERSAALNATDVIWLLVLQLVIVAVLGGMSSFTSRSGVVLRFWGKGVTTRTGTPGSGVRALADDRCVVAGARGRRTRSRRGCASSAGARHGCCGDAGVALGSGVCGSPSRAWTSGSDCRYVAGPALMPENRDPDGD